MTDVQTSSRQLRKQLAITVMIHKSSFSTKSSSLLNFKAICRTLHELLAKETLLIGTGKCYVKKIEDEKKRPM